MPRVIVYGKLVYLGYLDSSARYLIQEILRLAGQSFTWDDSSDTLYVEPAETVVDAAPPWLTEPLPSPDGACPVVEARRRRKCARCRKRSRCRRRVS